jgi:hypothetical protein
MERYVAIEIFHETHQANLACARLESRGVPVMIEHLRVSDPSLAQPYVAFNSGANQRGPRERAALPPATTVFRVLVPESACQLAYGVLAGMESVAPTAHQAA